MAAYSCADLKQPLISINFSLPGHFAIICYHFSILLKVALMWICCNQAGCRHFPSYAKSWKLGEMEFMDSFGDRPFAVSRATSNEVAGHMWPAGLEFDTRESQKTSRLRMWLCLANVQYQARGSSRRPFWKRSIIYAEWKRLHMCAVRRGILSVLAGGEVALLLISSCCRGWVRWLRFLLPAG